MENNEKKISRLFIIRIAILCSILAVLTILGYGLRLGTGNMVHSDDTCMIFVVQDWLSGNFFLKDWYLSTGTFGLPAFELTLVTALFGYHDTLIYLLAGLNYAIMVLTVILVVYAYAKKKDMNRGWIYSVVVCAIIIAPREKMLLNAGTQVLAYSASIIALYVTCYQTGILKRRYLRYLWGIFLGFLAITNSMFLYTACIPILAAGVLAVFLKKDQGIKIAELGIVTVCSYALFQKIWIHFRGMDLGGLSTTFTTRDKIWGNLASSFCNILELYGINFWGESVFSIKTLSAFVGLIVLGKISVEIYKFVTGGGYKEDLFFNMVFLMALVNAGAYAFSHLGESGGGIHLLEPFLLGYTMAGVLAWIDNASKRKQADYQVSMLVLSFLLLFLVWPDFTLQRPDNSGKKQAAEYLVNHGYEKGFATFWSAASVMYESEGNLVISPVSYYSRDGIESASIRAQYWMNKEEWIRQEGNFLITDSVSESKAGLTEAGILDAFGQWSDHQVFEDVNVYLWDEYKTLE